jgi:hypothetical protein
VELPAGGRARVIWRLHADRAAFTGLDGNRLVEPGEFQIWVGRSAADLRLEGGFGIAGAARRVGADRVLTTPVRLERIE